MKMVDGTGSGKEDSDEWEVQGPCSWCTAYRTYICICRYIGKKGNLPLDNIYKEAKGIFERCVDTHGNVLILQ